MADVPIDCYRSCRSSAWGGRRSADAQRQEEFLASHGAGSLYPDYSGFTRGDGSFRAPDVTTLSGDDGATWVRGVEDRDARDRAYVGWREGVSLSSQRGGFGYRGWFYFLLPQGTPIPPSLDVAHTPSRRDEHHYSLRCRNLMRRDAYEGALDTLARSAIARAVELARPSVCFE